AARDFLQSEFDERRGLFRIIDARLDGVGMPAKGEKTFGFDALDGDFERHALLLLLKFGDFRVHGSSDNFSGDARARFERSVELHAKPGAKFFEIAQGAPDAFERSAEKNFFLDAVRSEEHTSELQSPCN